MAWCANTNTCMKYYNIVRYRPPVPGFCQIFAIQKHTASSRKYTMSIYPINDYISRIYTMSIFLMNHYISRGYVMSIFPINHYISRGYAMSIFPINHGPSKLSHVNIPNKPFSTHVTTPQSVRGSFHVNIPINRFVRIMLVISYLTHVCGEFNLFYFDKCIRRPQKYSTDTTATSITVKGNRSVPGGKPTTICWLLWNLLT